MRRETSEASSLSGMNSWGGGSKNRGLFQAALPMSLGEQREAEKTRVSVGRPGALIAQGPIRTPRAVSIFLRGESDRGLALVTTRLEVGS